MESSAQVDYDKTKKDLVSDFNEAKFQIFRLHLLWQSCNTLSQSGLLTSWKWKLDCIWRELASDAKKKDDEIEKEENKYSNKIDKLNKKIADAKKDTEKVYNSLQEKEIFLRCLQDDVGKGSRRSSSEGDDMDE